MYDAHGQFLRAFRLPWKPYTYSIDTHGNLHAWTSTTYRKYSPMAELVSEEKITEPPPEALKGALSGKEVIDRFGNRYRVDTYLLVSERVLKTDPSGKTRVLVSQPWYLVLLKWPEPSGLYGVVSLAARGRSRFFARFQAA